MAMKIGHEQFGFKAVEFDVMLTKDLVPVLMHDSLLQRTTESEHNGKLLCDVMSADVLDIDAGSWFDPTLTDVRIPLFEDVIKFCVQHEIWMNIEIKPVDGFEAVTGEVVAAMTSKYFPVESSPNLPLFSSFSHDALKSAHRIAPHIPRGFLIESIDQTVDWQAKLSEIEAVSLHLQHDMLSKEQVSMIKSAGYAVFCYTVNDLGRSQELLQWGVESFCTDRLDLFNINLV